MLRDSPLYVLKGRLETEGALQLLSFIKKSSLNFRTYDHIETPRLSFHDARRHVARSIGVISHLCSPNRSGSLVQNGLAAFVSGLALAQEKIVVMIQEEHTPQPIDYRDIIQGYSKASDIPRLLEKPLRSVISRLQVIDARAHSSPSRLLDRLDLGDLAAENEISGLRNYFYRTGQYNQARRGNTRLIVGRKGTGKTALFYGVRQTLGGRQRLYLDLKPEGHQFTKLKEALVDRMSEGLQEHTLAAFWTYILLCELARRVCESDVEYAKYDPQRLEAYSELETLYAPHRLGHEADFSQRLLHQVNRLAAAATADSTTLEDSVTDLVYQGDIHQLSKSLGRYLSERDEVWILIDNLDKGWPTQGTTGYDVLILRTLLDATRSLQRELASHDTTLHVLVFIRTDIYDHLLRRTPDKGKDTAIRLDWDDPELFKEIVRLRIQASLGDEIPTSTFEIAWKHLFASHVGTRDSFAYMLERTLMRPRELLSFLQTCVEVALNRNHDRVREDDIEQAERSHSADTLLLTAFEIEDAYPEMSDVLYVFQGADAWLECEEVEKRLVAEAEIKQDALAMTAQLLLWYGFLGVVDYDGNELYSYSVKYNLRQLEALLRRNGAMYCVHPAFRSALDIRS